MLPGTFWHWSLYKDIISSVRPSIFYDGVNSCVWNGGRNNVDTNLWDDDIVKLYYRHSHRIALTFSNEEIDVKDAVGNFLLEKLSEKDNYVILRNVTLAEHVRKNYPNLHLIYSIVGTEHDYRREFYKSILELYDYVVPRFHHILKIREDFPSELDRFEIMINHSCPSTCPYWSLHYSIIENENRNKKTYRNYDTSSITCLINEKLTDSDVSDNVIHRRLQKSLSLGYTRFKLAGREFPTERLKKDLLEVKELL